MGCLGECWDLGPPPDSILNLPPPPVPAFLQHPLPDLLLNTTPCSSTQLCESWPLLNRVIESGGDDYVEMPRKDVETWSVTGIDDTWLLVLVASSIGVLLLGALLAMFLLKCREMHIFDGNECSMHSRGDHRQMKNHEPRECASVANLNGNKLIHPTETVMYHGGANIQDNRMVWAALTPHGTQHFISENYPRDLIDYGETDDHYEAVDHLNIQPVVMPLVQPVTMCNNSYQKDYDYEDPTPLIESYQLNDMENCEIAQYSVIDNTDMRCASLGFAANTIRRAYPLRPRVSSPTRIEHPNLPPLNLYPHKSNTLKRNTLSYRSVDAGTLPKYGC